MYKVDIPVDAEEVEEVFEEISENSLVRDCRHIVTDDEIRAVIWDKWPSLIECDLTVEDRLNCCAVAVWAYACRTEQVQEYMEDAPRHPDELLAHFTDLREWSQYRMADWELRDKEEYLAELLREDAPFQEAMSAYRNEVTEERRRVVVDKYALVMQRAWKS